MQEAKRQRVSDLLRAYVTYTEMTRMATPSWCLEVSSSLQIFFKFEIVLSIVASGGNKWPPIFIKQGVKINTQVYQWLLRYNVLPWLKATYPNGNYVFQQDSAPTHKANTTQEWMKRNLANYWPWTLWPPSSLCLNPLN